MNGRTPLTGGRDRSKLARSSSWPLGLRWIRQRLGARASWRSFRQGWISHWVLTRTTAPLWWNRWRGSHLRAEQLEDAPYVICQPCRHRWCAGMSCMFRFAQFMMRKAKMGRRANQVHPGFSCSQTTSGMAAFARQGGEPLPHGAIEQRNYGRIEHRPPL